MKSAASNNILMSVGKYIYQKSNKEINIDIQQKHTGYTSFYTVTLVQHYL